MGIDQHEAGTVVTDAAITIVLAGYFAGLEARGADILTLCLAAYEGTDALDIWIPATTSLAHGVRDIVAKAGPFAADIAV